MGIILHLVIDGQPIPKARPYTPNRETRRGRKPVSITPEKTKNWETTIRLLGRSAVKIQGAELTDQSLACVAMFRRQTKVKADGDNMLKSLLDGLQGELYFDDHQIRRQHFDVIYGIPDPCIEAWFMPRDDVETYLSLVQYCMAWEGQRV